MCPCLSTARLGVLLAKYGIPTTISLLQNQHQTPERLIYQLPKSHLKATKLGKQQNQAWTQQGQTGIAYEMHNQ